jgi:hypothetical protein
MVPLLLLLLLQVINATLDELIAKCKQLVEEEDVEFSEEFLSEQDPSILHFLIASGALTACLCMLALLWRYHSHHTPTCRGVWVAGCGGRRGGGTSV